jgi:hypothetical protein
VDPELTASYASMAASNRTRERNCHLLVSTTHFADAFAKPHGWNSIATRNF